MPLGRHAVFLEILMEPNVEDQELLLEFLQPLLLLLLVKDIKHGQLPHQALVQPKWILQAKMVQPRYGEHYSALRLRTFAVQHGVTPRSRTSQLPALLQLM
jgi:hypothetical protein